MDGVSLAQTAHCQILADLNEAEQVVADTQCRVSDKIRLALPLGLGTSQLAEPINQFMDDNLEIEIDLNDRQIDLIDENIDLAIRVGDLQNSSLIARKLARVHFAICASSAYLARFGEPQHPAELSAHEVLVYSNVAVGRQWFYQQDGKRVSPRMKYRLSANNGEYLATIAKHGLGIVSGPLAFLQDLIERGELVQILTGFTRQITGMYAVYPPGRLVSQRVRVFSDALYAHFRERSI